MMDAILFYVFGGLALGSGLVVVGQRNPLYSAFALIVTLCSLSAIYGLLGSPFIAVLQIVVYAGAIMVLFLFVLMLLNVRREEQAAGDRRAFKALGLVLTVLLVVEVGAVLLRHAPGPSAPGFDASTKRMAEILFSTSRTAAVFEPYAFLYVFEATSILILAALVGAVALAKKDVR